VLSEQEIYHFIQTSYPRVVVAVAFLTGSVAAAEDAVQEALVRAWVKAEKGEAIDSLPAWVTTVAMNLSRKAWRRALAERRAKERLPPADGSSRIEVEEAIDVRAALARLPRRQRETAVLRYVLEMDTREVAGVLGVDEGTVKSHLSRARAALALTLASEEASDDVAT
jgi:RNA polymerase sigma-70 factor (ECF subfamily)